VVPPPAPALALVRAVRAHGDRPAAPGPGAPSWRAVADDARHLGLGLRDAGLAPGRRAVVEGTGLAPHQVLERELAVLSTGAVLALDPGDEVSPVAVVGADELRVEGAAGPVTCDVDRLRRRGRAVDAEAPDRYEALLAALDPADPSVALPGRQATGAEVTWALRAVDRWLAPAFDGEGPGPVLVVDDGPGRGAAAVLGRWWPARAGAPLVDPGTDPAEAARRAGATVVVAGPGHWRAVAAGLRDAGARSRATAALLRRGRVVAAGEPAGPVERAGLAATRRWVGAGLRDVAGVAGLRAGVAWDGLDPVDARDLAAALVPVVPTWCVAGALAPVASAPVARPEPASGWGRPLPGRDVVADGSRTTIRGGDLPGGRLTLVARTAVDGRGRVRLPRPPRGPGGGAA